MKVKKKVITDHCGSASQIRAIIREVLWGLVGKIDDSNGENEVVSVAPFATTNLPTGTTDTHEDSALPLQFGSKNIRKRKGGRDNDKCSNKRQHTGMTSTLPVPKYNGTLLEDNVYVANSQSKYAGQIIRILGTSSTLPIGTSVVGRVLGKCGWKENDTTYEIIDIQRSLLRTIPAEDRHQAHKLVQIDEQRILTKGMPEGVHLKYWDQRYRLLSLFDHGIRLDAESWYSITPEAVAKHVTSSCIGRARELRCDMRKVLDCFSGCGGNTIPFAAMARKVVSVDLDPVKLTHLRQNCGVYGVDLLQVDTVCAEVYQLLSALIPADELKRIRERYDQILKDTTDPEEEVKEGARDEENGDSSSASESAQFDKVGGKHGTSPLNASIIEGTASAPHTNISTSVSAVSVDGGVITEEQLALCRGSDLIILSPPWGGPDYLNAKTYDLYTMLTSGCGLYMAMLAAAISPNLLFLLPVNTCEEQIKYIADVIQKPYVIEYVVINNSPKVMAVYMGNIVAKKQTISVSKLATNIGTSNNHRHFESVE